VSASTEVEILQHNRLDANSFVSVQPKANKKLHQYFWEVQ